MVLSELLKDLLDVLAMVGQVLGVNEDVINIHYHTTMEELPEHLVHKFLEDGEGKAEGHYEVLVVAGRSNECRLPLIAFLDPNEVLRTSQVQLRENVFPTEFL